MSCNRMRLSAGAPRRTVPAVAAGLWLAAAAFVPGCSGEPGDAVIARVGDRPIRLEEFEPALHARRVGPLEISDAVKSRLLDQYLEQQLLVAEARRRGIQVNDAEIARALGEDAAADAEGRREMRSSLLVAKLQQQVVQETAGVTAEEEERFYEEHRDAFRSPRVVAIRQILLEDAAEAETLRAELAREPGRFAEVAARSSLSPDRGGRRSLPADDLPDDVARVLEEMEPGEVSPVVEVAPHFLVVLLEEVRTERNVPLEEARPLIQEQLRDERADQAWGRLLAELRRSVEVEVFAEELPFRYVEEDPA